MPLIKVQASVDAPAQETVDKLLKSLSGKLAKHLSKSESYVMTAFEAGLPMTFAGTSDPACYIEVKSIGTMSPDQTQAMSQDFCQEANEVLGIPENRIYIGFTDVERHLWGWDGRTFG